MKKFTWVFAVFMISMTLFSLGCSNEPGEVKVEPMKKEEIDQNTEMGKVPGT